MDYHIGVSIIGFTILSGAAWFLKQLSIKQQQKLKPIPVRVKNKGNRPF
ncbi:hypothetical protein [Algivirga pacifica]